MRKTDLVDILNTVEQIRQELHPDLEASFIESVVHAEEACPDDADALRQIQSALNRVLKNTVEV